MPGKVPSIATAEEQIGEIRTWFIKYAVAFAELASCRRTDIAVLLEYYEAPARIVGLSADMVMRSSQAVIGFGGVGAEIEHLRRNGLVHSTIADLRIDLVSARGAVVEATSQREFSTGEITRFKATYVVVRGQEGWRITTVIEQPL